MKNCVPFVVIAFLACPTPAASGNLGVPFVGTPGSLNAITDVAAVA